MLGVVCISAYADDYSVPVYGIMRDAEGNIVEVVPMTRAVYVNSVHTFPAGGTFTTYQYSPNSFFNAMIAFKDTNGNKIATSNGTIAIQVFSASSVGGVRTAFTQQRSYSTNQTSSTQDVIGIQIDQLDFSKPYYNAVYTNLSKKAVTIRLVIECDS